MRLNVQKRLAADVLKVSTKRVKLDTTRLDEIKEAITKQDVKALIGDKAIVKVNEKGVSKARAKKIREQKSKGRKKGHPSRRGTPTSRVSKKERWMAKIRAQRELLKTLNEKNLITAKTYRELYAKAKGGFFRNKRHIKLYIEEHELVIKDGKK